MDTSSLSNLNFWGEETAHFTKQNGCGLRGMVLHNARKLPHAANRRAPKCQLKHRTQSGNKGDPAEMEMIPGVRSRPE